MTSDGASSMMLGGPCVVPVTPPVTGYVRFGAGTDGAQPAPASTYFDNFTITCQ